MALRIWASFGSCAATKSGRFRNRLSGVQLVEQSLGVFQIERVEAFGEPAVDWSEQFASLLPLALGAPEARLPGPIFFLKTKLSDKPLVFADNALRVGSATPGLKRYIVGFL